MVSCGVALNVPHAVQFRVTFPRTMQTFYGMLFTGDGRVMTGTSILQGRETGFKFPQEYSEIDK